MLTFAWFFPVFWGVGLGVFVMLLHECGHMLVATCLGVRIKAVGFRWQGLYVVRDAGTPAKNMIISLAGPLTNAVLLFGWPFSKHLFLANFCCAFVNLLPIKGSDGDRALTCWHQMQEEKRNEPNAVIPTKSAVVPQASERHANQAP